MTAYHPTRIPGRPRRFWTTFGLILFFVLLIGLSQTPIRQFANRVSIGMLSPLWSIGRGVEIFFIGLGGIFSSKLSLVQENVALRSIVNQQSIALLNQTILKQENIILRQIVNRAMDAQPLTIGRLENRGEEFPLGVAIIDTGFQNTTTGLSPGVVVVSEGAVILGELIEIYPKTAKMHFYSTTGERLMAQLGEMHVPIEITGRGAGNFIASLPRDLIVAIGDRVTLTVAGHEFILAVVSDIKRTAGDSFQEIFLRVPVNISQLTWVEMYAP
ncbi:MAG TPA: hypothetical protein VJB69_00405 [Candidatus Paceibacterota bacterium]